MIDKGDILIVDDTHASLKLLTDILTKEGFQVRPADSGELALSSVAAKLPELILLDMRMSGMDGVESMKQVMTFGVVRDIEFIGLKGNNERFIGELSVSVLKDSSGMPSGFVGITKDITERKQAAAALQEAAKERAKLIQELQFALDNVKTLQGLIPICASCKKIRDDEGFWSQVEGYLSKHTDAKFSHGLCPDCSKKIYGDLYEKVLEEQKKKIILSGDN